MSTKYADVKMFETIHGYVKVTRDGQDQICWPKEIVKGLTRAQIMARVEANTAAYQAIQEKVKSLPAGVTFGYLGNIGTTYDDRTYHLFLPHPGRVGTWKDQVGDYRPWQLDAMLGNWDQLISLAERRLLTYRSEPAILGV